MTRQAVCQTRDLFCGLFQVAIQTPTHVHLHYRSRNRHVTHLAMAGFAVDACSQVSLMAEVHEVGLLVHALPRDWLVSLPVAGQDLDSRVIRRDGRMAAHAFLHRGYACHVRTHCAGMAEQTLHASLDVSPVAVGDGLIGRCQDLRASENYTTDDHHEENGQNDGCPAEIHFGLKKEMFFVGRR
jgi:hypothetical protein